MERERLVLPGEADLSPILIPQLLQRRLDAAAERALEVRPFDDGDRRILGAQDGRVADLDLRRHGRLRLPRGLHVLGDEHLVELLQLHALLQRRVGLLDLLVDHRLERLEGLRSRDEPAVDEERRRAVGADLVRSPRVALDRRGDLRRVLVLAPAGHVEADLLRPLLVLCVRQLLLVLEHQLVHLPELALLVGRQGRLGRGQRVGMERQGLVPPDELHLALVRVEDSLERRLDARAEGALEIGELDDGHLRLLGAGPRRVGAQVDVPRRRGGSRRLLLRGRCRRRGLSVLHQRLVEVLARDAFRQRLVGALQRRVDHRLELLDRLGSRDPLPVDVEVGRAVGAQRARLRLVRFDLVLGLLRIRVAVEAVQVEPHGSARDVRLEQLVVHLPELALLACGDRRARRERRVRMDGQRVVLEGEADVLAIARLDLLQHFDGAPAERALEIGELDDRDLRLGISFHRGCADGDVVDDFGAGREWNLRRGWPLGAQRRAHRAAGMHLHADEVTDRTAHARSYGDIPRILHDSISSAEPKQ